MKSISLSLSLVISWLSGQGLFPSKNFMSGKASTGRLT